MKKKFFAKLFLGVFLVTALGFGVFVQGNVMDEGGITSENELFNNTAYGASSKTFSDVEDMNPYAVPIYYLKDLNIVGGYSDGTFKPEANVNRAEFLKIMMEATNETPEGSRCYGDVKDQWFASYVCKAKKLGYVSGYKNGLFKPDQSISFSEASKMVANILKLDVVEGEFDTWFHPYVSALSDVKAIPATVTSFDQNLTRAEMADMIWRIKTHNYYRLSNTYDGILEGKPAKGDLKAFSSCDDLKGYIKSGYESSNYSYNYMRYGGVAEGEGDFSKSVTPSAMNKEEGGGGGEPGYSGTNLQVEGVDEADMVKTDGKYIYSIIGDAVKVTKAYPPTDMTQVTSVTFGDANFYSTEMYVDGSKLVVIGSSYEYYYDDGSEIPVTEADVKLPNGSYTVVYIYDITDKTKIKLDRKLSFEGYYSSSRKVNDMLYLVMTQYKYYDYYYYDDVDGSSGASDNSGGTEIKDTDLMPLYLDSKSNKVAAVTSCSNVRYMPGVDSTDFMIVSGIPLDDVNSKVRNETVLGASGQVYASEKNLYVASQYYSPFYWDFKAGTYDDETVIHKFKLNRDGVTYSGTGSIPGKVLNQFSMDESDGYFRVATTEGNTWDAGNPSTNSLYVLDQDLNVAGKVDGLAPGEQIYSTRFIGDRAYMVTFRTIDPLFVIDLSDPASPKVLGELKIPGVSDYLHPFDETHIIGFGLATNELTTDEIAQMGTNFVWFQGIKLSMFDVSDVTKPKELHSVVIGDRGTYSELEYNHKALLFDKNKGIMAFPITVAEIPADQKVNSENLSWTYGNYTYQGAYIYDVSIKDGFKLRGKLTHFDDFNKEYNENYDWSKAIARILYIGDYFYTVSQNKIMANQMKDLVKVKDAVFGE
jgi:uncharacterized secreted protein with C-terminal beta-propeller domain